MMYAVVTCPWIFHHSTLDAKCLGDTSLNYFLSCIMLQASHSLKENVSSIPQKKCLLFKNVMWLGGRHMSDRVLQVVLLDVEAKPSQLLVWKTTGANLHIWCYSMELDTFLFHTNTHTYNILYITPAYHCFNKGPINIISFLQTNSHNSSQSLAIPNQP